MAAKLQCEICGGKLIGKPGGIFECEYCGTEYSTEWARAKLQEITGTVRIEGPVEVRGQVQVDGPVQVDGTANVESLTKRGFLSLEDKEWDKAKEIFDQILSIDPENGDAYLGLVMAEAKTASKSEFQAAYTDHRIDESGNLRRAKQFALAEQTVWWSKLDAGREAADIDKKEKRKAAEKAEENHKRKEEAQAQEDTNKVIAAIRAKTGEEGLTLETQLVAARQKAEQLTQLCAAYDGIQVQSFQRESWLEQFEQKKNELQKRRTSLGFFSGKEKKQIESELTALERQATQVKVELSNLLKQLQGFETKAQVEQEKAKALAAVAELQQKPFEQKANQSRSFSYEQAIEVLLENRRVRELVYQKDAAMLQCIPIGAFLIALVDSSISSISFGKYPQKRNSAPDPIEWQILKRESNRILIISKYALDCKQYNMTYTDVTWETCTLREWLNNDFLNIAFTDAERKMILIASVSADRNPYIDTNPGNATHDKVFLLSISEVNKYFIDSYDARECTPTDYAISQGVQKDNYSLKSTCFWLLRSPGKDFNHAACVSDDGVVYGGGALITKDYAVRPALWINLGP